MKIKAKLNLIDLFTTTCRVTRQMLIQGRRIPDDGAEYL